MYLIECDELMRRFVVGNEEMAEKMVELLNRRYPQVDKHTHIECELLSGLDEWELVWVGEGVWDLFEKKFKVFDRQYLFRWEIGLNPLNIYKVGENYPRYVRTVTKATYEGEASQIVKDWNKFINCKLYSTENLVDNTRIVILP